MASCSCVAPHPLILFAPLMGSVFSAHGAPVRSPGPRPDGSPLPSLLAESLCIAALLGDCSVGREPPGGGGILCIFRSHSPCGEEALGKLGGILNFLEHVPACTPS